MPTLKPFQQDAVKWCLEHPRSVLNLDTGLGKTAVSIAVAVAAKSARILVVCPAYLIFQWEQEIKFWTGTAARVLPSKLKHGIFDANARFHICSFNYVAQDHSTFERYDTLIIDESHYLKNGQTKRVKAVINKLATKIRRVHCLTATYTVNSAVDLHPTLSFLEPGVWPGTTIFGEMYANKKPDSYQPCGYRWVGVKNEHILLRKTAHLIYSKSKDDPEIAAQLPSISYHNLYMRSKIKNPLKGIDLDDPVALQAALKTPKDDDESPMTTACIELAKSKVDFAAEWLENLPSNQQVVVFGWHTEPLLALAAKVAKFTTCDVVTGKTPHAMRVKHISKFQAGKTQVLMGSVGVLGAGHNLQNAAIAFWLELPWTFAQFKQGSDRVHRIGSTKPVRVYRLIAPGSIDEFKISCIKSKRELGEALAGQAI